jgi:hypothetical protein
MRENRDFLSANDLKKRSSLRLLTDFDSYFKFCLCSIISLTAHLCAVEEYESWWEKCLETSVPLSTFDGWLGDIHAQSRIAMRTHVKKMGYQSLLDIPSGLCTEYFGFKHDQMQIEYQGLDITSRLVKIAHKQNIPVLEGDIKSIPFANNRFEICYARHILEHLASYEQAIDELIRVASKEVLITFFMRPSDVPFINLFYYENHLLYSNVFNKTEMEQFILSNPKVIYFDWEEVDGRELILHIFLRG